MEPALTSKKAYLVALYEHIGKGEEARLHGKPGQKITSSTRAFYHKLQQQQSISLADFKRLNLKQDPDPAVLVVENIDLDWITTLGVTLSIDSYFFAEHILSPLGQQGQTPWNTIFGKWSATWRKPIHNGLGFSSMQPSDAAGTTRKVWHVDGVYQYEGQHGVPVKQLALIDPNYISRQIGYDVGYGWQATTRISYCLVHPTLCKCIFAEQADRYLWWI